MPDERPLRDVLREGEELRALSDDACRPLAKKALRLARELRAIAPLLRDLCVLATCNDVRGDDALVTCARALADELEAR